MRDEVTVRAAVEAWLAQNWDPELSLVEWRSRLVDAGWAQPSWPTSWHGQGLPSWADTTVSEALREVGAVGLPLGVGTGLAGPTILEHGRDSVRARFLRPLLTGEERWCQLFSEPGSGSDLASASTTAVHDGDEWIVNGQKVWNTSAQHADYGILVARTDWNVPKHRGLTYFVLPMRQSGVEVRPLRQMNFHQSFNEVFLSDARIPADHVVGEVGDGWRVALTTLAHERRFGSMSRPRFPLSSHRVYDEAKREADEHFATYAWYPQRAGRADLVAENARRNTTVDPCLARQAAAAVYSVGQAARWNAERAIVARRSGKSPGPEGSLGKLASSDLARSAARAHSLLGGASGMLSGRDAPRDGVIAEVLISVPAQSIAGGTDQIQRNIIGEKVLGLPREPSNDTDVAFRDVARNSRPLT